MPESIFGMEGKEIDVRQFKIVLGANKNNFRTFSWIFEVDKPYKNLV